MATEFNVVMYRLQTNPHGARELAFIGVVSGMGKNRNTWDSGHSRSAAYRHAKDLRKTCADAGMRFRVEVIN